MAFAIDRKALISRHNPAFYAPSGNVPQTAPFSVGNGRFCFTADGTGLQSAVLCPADAHLRFPFLTMAEWYWHSYPDAPGGDLRLTPFDTYGRDVGYATDDAGQESLFYSLRRNAHKGNLARIGLAGLNGVAGIAENIVQELNLWEGVLYSTFTLNDRPVHVETLAHPYIDALCIYIESPLVKTGGLGLRLDFPYPSHKKEAGDWNVPDKHHTRFEQKTGRIFRQADNAAYTVAVGNKFTCRRDGPHTLVFIPETTGSSAIEASFLFAPGRSSSEEVPSFIQSKAVCTAFWADYWGKSGALEFQAQGASADGQAARELERRIVLSRYLCAIQARGDYPPAETGLTCNSWYGKFHLEMHFWHHAHFPLWGQAADLARSMEFYLRILPEARSIAARQGYKGARWPKMCDITGRNSPSSIAPLLLWQQPHPIMLAKLLFLAAQTGPERNAILEKYREIIAETADFMADFIVMGKDGQGRLGPPVIPVQERFDPQTVVNPSFELEYWRWGLHEATLWLESSGKNAPSAWEAVRASLPAPACYKGIYTHHAGNAPALAQTLLNRAGAPAFLTDHPSMLMMTGVLPDSAFVDKTIMNRTFDAVLLHWDLQSLWGWDFPMMALVAAALGRQEDALRLLLLDNPRNRYLANGHNEQGDDDALPLYLPGNAALLLVTALMAKKGMFPSNWAVRAEGLGDYVW